MKRQILLNKATRIEGNATIRVEVDQDRVQSARFMVADFRGFEKLCQGKKAAHIPHIISRICGLCCTAHQVASMQAIENALQIDVGPTITKLRQAAVYGEWITSHAISYFFLTQPDLMGTDQGIFGLIQQHPQIAETAFAIKQSGERIIELLGGRAVHPIAMDSACLTAWPSNHDREEVVAIAREVAQRAHQMIAQLDQRRLPENRIPFPQGSPVNFLCYAPHDGTPGHLNVYGRHGRCEEQFSVDDVEDHVSEMRVDWSYAKFPYLTRRGFPEGIFHVGPLSRANLADSATRLPELAALDVIRQARQARGEHIEYIDVIRLAEIYWAARKIETLLQPIDLSKGATAPIDLRASGKGVGVVEAPRGVLIHSYTINRGRIERLKLLVATQFNNPLINLIIKDLAERHMAHGALSDAGQMEIGRCIRLFDPCLTCATH